MGLLAENRHEYILEQLRSTGRVLVRSVAEELNVTEVTIRRDLTIMAKRGLLKKIYGGAVLAGPPGINRPVRFRHSLNLPAKKTIGQLSAGLLKDGDVIYLEAGSTCYEIIPYLGRLKGLTIIANSLNLMSRLHEQPQHRLIVTGGQYRPDRMDMIGPAARAVIEQLNSFIAFTGADDISIHAGISGADVATVSFAKLILQQASKVIFVGDHTKFDNPALYKIADLERLDYIVTDSRPAEAWCRVAEEKNITLIYPQ